MPGQGVIVGVGAIDYPAEWQAADPRVLAELGVSKVVTITSTYDHRIIQGAESGLFLQRVHRLLTGEDAFYERVFKAMGVPYEPVRYHRDINDIAEGSSVHAQKQIEVDNLINLYRVRGHLIAHLDPLDWTEPHMHPELDPATHGLTRLGPRPGVPHQRPGRAASACGSATSWACCATPTAGRSASSTCTSRSRTRSAGSRSTSRGCPTQLSADEHRWILDRLNAAEALEQFLNTKYIGQKRFGLEGGEAAIPLIDAVLDDAAVAGQAEAVIGMAHRGRLNVLINIVGKSYGELFEEFEGNIDPGTVQGSGDVKYHKGFRGKFTGRSGRTIDVVLASNPSHLEAVDPVVEGMARALQDQLDKERGRQRPSRPAAAHPRRRRLRRPGRGGRDPQHVGPARLRDRRHRPPGHQQPARLHDQPGVGPVVGLRHRRGQDGPGPDLPRQRRRPRGLRPGRPAGLRLPAGVPQGRRHRHGLLPAVTATTSRTIPASPSRCSTS